MLFESKFHHVSRFTIEKIWFTRDFFSHLPTMYPIILPHNVNDDDYFIEYRIKFKIYNNVSSMKSFQLKFNDIYAERILNLQKNCWIFDSSLFVCELELACSQNLCSKIAPYGAYFHNTNCSACHSLPDFFFSLLSTAFTAWHLHKSKQNDEKGKKIAT